MQKNFSHLPGCLHNDRTQNLMIRMYAQTDPHMLDFRSTFLFPAMIARNIFTFCRDLYQSRLRSVSISYVFTSFLGCMTMNSLKTNCLQLASLIVLNLLQLQNRRNGKKTSDNAPNDKLVDELKLGFFFQDSLNHPRELRKVC